MRGAARHTTIIALLLVVLQAPALADMTVYSHAGRWDAFTGPGEGGTPVCGIGTTNPTDNRILSLRIQLGTENVTFQAKKPSWQIPSNTMLPVVMQIGSDPPWKLQASGAGQIVTWALDRDAMQTFNEQFRRSNSMVLSFPTGSEAAWTVTLIGSTAISNTWKRCVTDLARRDGTLAASPAPAGPAQPLGQPIVQSISVPPVPR